MVSSTPENICENEVSPVYVDTRSGDDPKVADRPEPDTRITEKVACERCRRRKIKCDRIHPCLQCIRAQSPCSYPVPQKPAKRQRVLISSEYESRVEHISQKIDNLAEMIEELSDPTKKSSSHSSRNRDETYRVENNTCPQPATAEHEGIDNSLFSHAIAATKLLEDAVKADACEGASSAALEIRSALDTLQAVVDSQNRRNAAYGDDPPFLEALQPGTTARDLPVPPMDKVMACLRMAQEQTLASLSWLGELKSLCDFTLYLVKVCSPGPATDLELIVAYMGLYWLFAECATVASNTVKQDLNKQAQICQNSLEATLSSLGFHIPTTIDSVLAMYLATLYCFQKGRIFSCWAFISKASLHAQALGLHNSASMTGDTVEERHRKTRLFWSIYSLERGVSLRLARPSTIRDDDITIPEPDPQPSTSATLKPNLVDSVNGARLYGHMFGEIYSPRALTQPAEARTARVHALATEWQDILRSKAQHLTKLARRFEGTPKSAMAEFTVHANMASDYVVLTAIYRATPGQTPASISTECTSAARIALQGHTECITLLLYNELYPVERDLNTLKALVQAIELLTKKPGYASCAKQLRVFEALYNVAARYVEVKGNAYSSARWGSVGLDAGKGPNDITVAGLTAALSHVQPSGGYVESASGMDSVARGGGLGDRLGHLPVPQVLESQTWAGIGGIELDPLGTQFGSWFRELNDEINFYSRLDHYLYRILGSSATLAQTRASSTVLLAAVCTVGALHLTELGAHFKPCYRHFRSISADLSLCKEAGLDDIRGLYIRVFFGSVSLATQQHFDRAAAPGDDGPPVAYDKLRLYYLVYVCDHHFSVV